MAAAGRACAPLDVDEEAASPVEGRIATAVPVHVPVAADAEDDGSSSEGRFSVFAFSDEDDSYEEEEGTEEGCQAEASVKLVGGKSPAIHILPARGMPGGGAADGQHWRQQHFSVEGTISEAQSEAMLGTLVSAVMTLGAALREADVPADYAKAVGGSDDHTRFREPNEG